MQNFFKNLPRVVGALFLLVSLSMAVRAIAHSFEIDHDYRIEFISDNPSGSFSGLKGTVNFDPEDLVSSSFDVTVDATSINTGNSLKNRHARGKGYFDTDQFPQIGFKSKEIQATDSGFDVTGNLNLKGITKSLSFPFTFNENPEGVKAFEGEFDINRLDYGIGGKGEKPSKVLHIKLYVPVK